MSLFQSTTEESKFFGLFPAAQVLWSLAQKKSSQDSLGTSLRRSKAQHFVEALVDEYFQKRPTKDICSRWSQQTDSRLTLAFQESLEGRPQNSALLGFGKLGSSELNLSSDVDLVWVCADGEEASAAPALRKFSDLIDAGTAEGFCHRIDFNLRPGGRLGPLVCTESQWWDYYSSSLAAWERLAFIRLRLVAGDSSLSERLLERAQLLTYRKYLDFQLLEEFKSLRQQIHSQNWMRQDAQTIDLKLGPGGIRDLELMVHTLQVIYGGREMTARQRGTSAGLLALEGLGALRSSDREFLECHYWRLRRLENLVQGVGDEQTHLLRKEFGLRIMTDKDWQGLRDDLQSCDRLVSGLLGPIDRSVRTLPSTIEDQMQWLSSLGLGLTPPDLDQALRSASGRALHQKDQGLREKFVFECLQQGADHQLDPARLWAALKEFLNSAGNRTSFLHLLLSHPKELLFVCRLFSSSGYLGQLLVRRPELIDVLLLKRQPELPAESPWEERLSLLRDRRSLAELLSGAEFLSNLRTEDLTRKLSQVADSIALDLLQALGRENPHQLQILALGKWGGFELGVGSDLDFVFLTQGPPTETDRQTARRWLNRLTQTPAIYSVDVRLKPFAGSGPLLLPVEELVQFLKTEAPAWQRQSYLRARVVGGSGDVQIREAAVARGCDPSELEELHKIRDSLTGKAPPLKFGPGGLLDLELAVQTEFLTRQQPPRSPNLTEQFQELGPSWTPLKVAYEKLRQREQWSALQGPDRFEREPLRSGQPPEFKVEIAELLGQNQSQLKHLDPRQRGR